MYIGTSLLKKLCHRSFDWRILFLCFYEIRFLTNKTFQTKNQNQKNLPLFFHLKKTSPKSFKNQNLIFLSCKVTPRFEQYPRYSVIGRRQSNNFILKSNFTRLKAQLQILYKIYYKIISVNYIFPCILDTTYTLKSKLRTRIINLSTYLTLLFIYQLNSSGSGDFQKAHHSSHDHKR